MQSEDASLDALDLNIITFLQNDGRRPYKEIADELGVNERTVRLRVNQMKANGTLQIIGIVNPISIGLKLIAVIEISVNDHQLEACIEQLAALQEVRFITLVSGEYQLMMEVCSRSHEELGEFLINKLNKISGIQKSNVTMELKILKNDFKFVREHGIL